MGKLPVRYMCPLILMMVSPLPAWALCCPSVGQKPARSGIGESQPAAADLSLDQRWRVHAFERDAISYLQVSDTAGSIQFILGKLDDYFWVLPAGPADMHVSLPSDDRRSSALTDAVEVYRDEEFKLMVSQSGSSRWWSVEHVLRRP